MDLANTLWRVSMVIGGVCCTSALHAASGADTALALQARYLAAPTNCGSTSKPRFLCAGLMLKSTSRSTGEKSWNPSAEDRQSGGSSFAYLGADATFNRLSANDANGFILYAGDEKPAGTRTLQVLCFFPTDGASQTRSDKGCGRSILSNASSDACHTQGITTSAAWLANYGNQPFKQCGFAVENGLGSVAVNGFNEGIRATQLLPTTPFKSNSEMRVQTWDQDIPEQLPIQAFFYLPNRPLALQHAQRDQVQFYKETGNFVPIITLTLPEASQQQPARFDFQQDSQAALGDVICDRYIASGRWFERSDVGTGKREWALGLVPTDCARAIKANPSAEAERVADVEVRNKFSRDWQWVQNDNGGMTQQLICHMRIAHDKPEWNLEPFRPNRPLEDYLSAGCNPLRSTTLTDAR